MNSPFLQCLDARDVFGVDYLTAIFAPSRLGEYSLSLSIREQICPARKVRQEVTLAVSAAGTSGIVSIRHYRSPSRIAPSLSCKLASPSPVESSGLAVLRLARANTTCAKMAKAPI